MGQGTDGSVKELMGKGTDGSVKELMGHLRAKKEGKTSEVID